MRGDLTALGPPSATPMAISSLLVTLPPSALNLGTPEVTLGFRRQGLISSIGSSVSGMGCVDSNPGAESTAVVKISEGFNSAFKVQGLPNFDPVGSLAESGYFAPGSYNGGGASGPTQIGLLFSKIPQGVTLSVPRTVQNNGLSLTVNGQTCGTGGSQPVAIDAGGSGTLVYNYCSGDTSAKENVDVPISASWSGAGSTGVGTGKVEVTLAPLTTGAPMFKRPGTSASFLTLTACAPPPPPPPAEDKPYLTKMSVYRDGKWLKDNNGDGLLGAGDSETTFGFKGAKPLAGDWDGDGKQEIAVYANIFGTGLWFLDRNGNGVWDDSVDQLSVLGWGNSLAQPVVGDWNGDGRAKIGVYSNGLWLLDYDGNGILNGGDKIFKLGGWQGSVPLVGDWNGNGRESAGIYVPGHFVLDYNADHHFENGPEDRVYGFGITGANVVPVIGDWNGNGKKKVGIFRAGQWLLDLNGDGQASGPGESLFFFGPKSGSPIVGDWAGIGKDTIGAVDDGAWYLDLNGDRIHNGLDPILFWGDEGANRIFIPGKWQSPDK